MFTLKLKQMLISSKSSSSRNTITKIGYVLDKRDLNFLFLFLRKQKNVCFCLYVSIKKQINLVIGILVI